MRNMREGGISIICWRWSLTGTSFFSSTAKTGVVLGMDMIISPLTSSSPAQFDNLNEGRGARQGGGGRVKITPRVFGAFGVPSEYEPVPLHLTTTNVP